MSYPTTIVFDIETAPITVATFSLWPDSINHTHILKDWWIITICWKELGKKPIQSISVLDNKKRFNTNFSDDYHVIEKFAKVLESAQILIGHNSDKFDLKKFNTRLIFHGLPPLPKPHSIDTLKAWKKIGSTTSNRLDYLGRYFELGGKKSTSKDLWIKAGIDGDVAAIEEMVKYCKRDVKLLEEFYLLMRPYMTNHPHLGAMSGKDRTRSCPNCGSTKLSISKTRYTAAGLKRVQKICNDCHHYSTHLPDKQESGSHSIS